MPPRCWIVQPPTDWPDFHDRGLTRKRRKIMQGETKMQPGRFFAWRDALNAWFELAAYLPVNIAEITRTRQDETFCIQACQSLHRIVCSMLRSESRNHFPYSFPSQLKMRASAWISSSLRGLSP